MISLRIRRKLMLTWGRLIPRLPLLQFYILRTFLIHLAASVFVATTLFLVFDFLERVQVFFREDATIGQALLYLVYRTPLVVQLMMPIAVLISVLLSIGRLSQLSEITAMRASGVSLFFLVRPLIYAGICISLVMLVAGETVVPWSTKQLEDLYQFEIQRKAETGRLNRANFWHRSGERFYNVDYYDSGKSMLGGLSVFYLNPETFSPDRRISAENAIWAGSKIGWVMHNVTEFTFDVDGKTLQTHFDQLPLVIPEKPSDFYERKTQPESLSYRELQRYITKLKGEGVPVQNYETQLQAKLAFPVINVILAIAAFPFALMTARSGTLTKSFVVGVVVGFTYYVVHALSMSLGSAELIPAVAAAWTANILLGSIGGYLILGAEHV